jgi:hypothetical protein
MSATEVLGTLSAGRPIRHSIMDGASHSSCSRRRFGRCQSGLCHWRSRTCPAVGETSSSGLCPVRLPTN